jgi:hypothetical protein
MFVGCPMNSNRPDNSFPILVQDTRGVDEMIIVFPDYTVGQVKTIFCTKRKLNLNPGIMRLIFSGNNLYDNQCLADIKVKKNNRIYLTHFIKC